MVLVGWDGKMPLTKTGHKILRHFQREYGRRGKAVFYAWEHKHPWVVKK